MLHDSALYKFTIDIDRVSVLHGILACTGTNLYCLVNRCACVWTTCPGSYMKWSGRDSNLRPVGCKSDAVTTTPHYPRLKGHKTVSIIIIKWLLLLLRRWSSSPTVVFTLRVNGQNDDHLATTSGVRHLGGKCKSICQSLSCQMC